jgi:hypothetical protein
VAVLQAAVRMILRNSFLTPFDTNWNRAVALRHFQHRSYFSEMQFRSPRPNRSESLSDFARQQKAAIRNEMSLLGGTYGSREREISSNDTKRGAMTTSNTTCIDWCGQLPGGRQLFLSISVTLLAFYQQLLIAVSGRRSQPPGASADT